ncbi:MAG: hypothetical protein ACRBCK_04705 [Alphaproteobacteria bacterium]
MRYILLFITLCSLSACESTRGDLIDVLNTNAKNAGRSSGSFQDRQ